MSTHVDGASPSVSPDPDDEEPRADAAPESETGGGSEWLRAEMQRRMAVNRATRGRHARTSEQPAAPRKEEFGPTGVRRNDLRRRTAPDPWAAGYATPADLPENYVPRHSVQTPGPAAEPAAPISGPIPIVPPADGPVVNGQPVAPPPVGGPSLPPSGLPMRRRRSSGPGRPLGGEDQAGPWSRPIPVVPNEPVRRLGAPPEVRGSAETAPSWGVPAGHPRSFVVPLRPSGVLPAVDDPTHATEPATEQPPAPPVAGPAPDSDAPTLPRRPVRRPRVRPAAEDGSDDEPAAVEAAAVPVEAPQAPEPGSPVEQTVPRANSAAPAVEAAPAAESAPDTVDHPAVNGSPQVASTPAVRSATAAPAESASEVTGEILDLVTTPHPVVFARRATLSGRTVGVPAQRTPEQARTATPRPATPRSIPVVGTAPPEPGSTRVRVVLSERKGVARPVRTIKEVQEGTPVGELLRRDLIRSQLKLTLRFAALTVLVLGSLPAVFALLPAVGQLHLLGLRLPWVLLGVLMYPFLVGVAWRYIRVADRLEQNFADHVQD